MAKTKFVEGIEINGKFWICFKTDEDRYYYLQNTKGHRMCLCYEEVVKLGGLIQRRRKNERKAKRKDKEM